MNQFSYLNSAHDLPLYLYDLGKDIVGCEIGIWKAENLCYLLRECNNISRMYAIDPYMQYNDWNRFIPEQEISQVKNIAFSAINASGNKDKVVFLEKTSFAAKNYIADESLDFIFIDGDHSYEKAIRDFEWYYSKVKVGGIFSGHDHSLPGVNKALYEFREKNNITSEVKLIQSDAWMWYK